jgi:tRNA threonylcarbamoyladenosine biosynthesis protein TsaB
MLLAVDTSTAQTGLALYDGAQVIGEMVWQSSRHHTQELAPAFAELLARTGLKTKSLQALGVAIGPGSFTSLRVGLAFAKGLAFARHLPLVGIPTLDIVAAAQPGGVKSAAGRGRDIPLAAILQAGRGRLALAWYRASTNGWRVLPIKKSAATLTVTDIESLADSIKSPTFVCGELTAEERQRLARKRRNVILASPAACVRRPGMLAELAWKRWQAGTTDDPASLAPIYLHLGEALPS